MNTLIILAWRNLWRNRRRTLITLASIFLAMFFSLVMRSMQIGSYDHLIQSTVGSSTGYLQIQDENFWDNRSLDKSFIADASLQSLVQRIPEIDNWIPRLDSFALASKGEITKGVPILGFDPQREESISKFQDKLIEGRIPEIHEPAVLLAEGLAHYMKLNVGDEIVLLGQGYHGMSANARYPIAGILRFPNPQQNKQNLYLPLQEAQRLFSCPDRLTSMALMLKDPNDQNRIVAHLTAALPKNNTVMTWQEMMPDLVQSIQVDSVSGAIMLGVLYVVVGFGVLGTVIMMTAERKREFGILLALGMKKDKLGETVILESLFLALTGIFLGSACGIPLLHYMHAHPIRFTGQMAENFIKMGYEPILPFAKHASLYMAQGSAVILMCAIAALYPLWQIYHLNIVKAIKE